MNALLVLVVIVGFAAIVAASIWGDDDSEGY